MSHMNETFTLFFGFCTHAPWFCFSFFMILFLSYCTFRHGLWRLGSSKRELMNLILQSGKPSCAAPWTKAENLIWSTMAPKRSRWIPWRYMMSVKYHSRSVTKVNKRQTISVFHPLLVSTHLPPFYFDFWNIYILSNAKFDAKGSSDAGSWTPPDDEGGEEDIPDTPESLPPYPSNGEWRSSVLSICHKAI